jgi:hypothetical protein
VAPVQQAALQRSEPQSSQHALGAAYGAGQAAPPPASYGIKLCRPLHPMMLTMLDPAVQEAVDLVSGCRTAEEACRTVSQCPTSIFAAALAAVCRG